MNICSSRNAKRARRLMQRLINSHNGNCNRVDRFLRLSTKCFEVCLCFFEKSNKAELLLVNINSVPASYSADGVAMAAISNTLEDRIDKLKDEAAWVAENFANIKITYKALIGNFIKTLQELVEEEAAVMAIVGTPAEFGEIWRWDVDTLRALTELPIPVLAVPNAVEYKPVANISFASIPGNLHGTSPINSIKKLVHYTGARLHVVSVVPQQHDEQKEQEAETALQDQLKELDTVYHKITGPHIVKAIGQFVEEAHIDLLVVRPRKHGVWYNLFHKSYAKELAKLNLIPVMALHDEWKVD